MILENLFARAAQEQAFLWLMACGLLLGLLLHLSAAVHRGHPWLGILCDMVFALCAGGMALLVLLRFGGGLRAYGLLGVLVGLLLYFAGLSRLLEGMAHRLSRLTPRREKKFADDGNHAGISSPGAENISNLGLPEKSRGMSEGSRAL